MLSSVVTILQYLDNKSLNISAYVIWKKIAISKNTSNAVNGKQDMKISL